MLAVGLAAAGIIIAVSLTLRAFQENMMFYVEIADVKAGNAPADRNFRVGGLVVEGSVQRTPGELQKHWPVMPRHKKHSWKLKQPRPLNSDS
jgi:cytochrome c-type biogenesis protein CcmE